MKRTERLFALAEVLRSRRTGVTAHELAERFGVSERTIHRDLTSLKNANMPISSERGRGGGFALDAHYSLPPINLSAREAAVLLMLLKHAKQMRLLPFDKSLEKIAEKIRAALSVSGQRELQTRLRELQFVGVPAKSVSRKIMNRIAQAWFEQSLVRFKYPKGSYGEQTFAAQIRGFVFDRRETRVSITTEDGAKRVIHLHKIL